MKSSNCLTRSLHHWNQYGGVIIYDSDHAKVVGGKRKYHDIPVQGDDIKEYGINYFLSAHKDFLNEEEIEILNRYFSDNT
jgi:hypothetical protein